MTMRAYKQKFFIKLIDRSYKNNKVDLEEDLDPLIPDARQRNQEYEYSIINFKIKMR